MTSINDLIESVLDPLLRSALHDELHKLLSSRRFGLVFNRHKPESVILPKFAVRRDDKVRVLIEGYSDRTDIDGTGVWSVVKVSHRVVEIRSKSEQSKIIEIPRDRVVVTREFGDAIYPGLRSIGKIEQGGDQPFHIVINGENYHALEALLYAYEGRVDAIYIDPPYNNGRRDWKYNNNYVDDQDPYRHSKWLSFMEKRLKLAKRLLKVDNSVLIVTIDEKEVHRLGLLLQQIFLGARQQMITTVINPGGVAREHQFTRVDEYILFVMLGSAAPCKTTNDMLFPSRRRSPIWRGLLRGGSGPLRSDSELKFFPIFVDPKSCRVVGSGNPLPLGENRAKVVPWKGTVAIWPIKAGGVEGRWELSRATFEERRKLGYVRAVNSKKENGKWVVYYLRQAEIDRLANGELISNGTTAAGHLDISYADDIGRSLYAKSTWNEPSHDAGTHGSGMLKKLIPGRKFPFPKSLYAVEDALRFFVKDKEDALILDFFGGSGTTAHAVARLNHQDGGCRRSIIVTNNEVSEKEAEELRARGVYPGDPDWEALGICQYVTIPRIRAAITGKTPEGNLICGDYNFVDEFTIDEGFAENAEFFELTYEDPALVSLGRKFSAIAPLVWMKAGAVGERIDQIAPRGWSVPKNATYGVLFDTNEWSDFIEVTNARHDDGQPLRHAFIVTDSVTEYQQIAAKLNSSLPTTRLYADYIRTFEINTSRDADL